jgi:hypothetical protein
MFKSLSNVTCKDSYAVTSFDKTEGLKPEETLSITACNKDMAGHVLSIINNSCDNSNASYERVKPTSKICNMIEDCLENDDLEFYVAYEKGNPVGLMVTDNSLYLTDNLMKPHLYMNYIVTAIGSNGVGIKLLETAVNKSYQMGGGGDLELNPYRPDFFLHTGFEKACDNNKLILIPSQNNDKWELLDGKYSYKKLR